LLNDLYVSVNSFIVDYFLYDATKIFSRF